MREPRRFQIQPARGAGGRRQGRHRGLVKNGKVRRLWAGDASLWTGEDEGKWTGWLHIAEQQLAQLETFERLAAEIKREKFKHALLLGMGGSSLCPEVLRMTFGKIAGFP